MTVVEISAISTFSLSAAPDPGENRMHFSCNRSYPIILVVVLLLESTINTKRDDIRTLI